MLLVLKLVLTPLLTLLLTLAGRKWGERVSGIVTGLPLNSGPISFLFALEYGTEFTAQAAVGSMGGMAAISAFALVYAYLARRWTWYVCAPAALAVFFVVVFVLDATELSLALTLVLTVGSLALAGFLMPHSEIFAEPLAPPRWDLPMRLISATAFVLLITALGQVLGPRLGGLASTFPIFATVMTVFAHRHQGAPAAIQWLRGCLAGISATVVFYLSISLTINGLPLLATYALAIGAALAVNAFMLHRTRQ
ncbi:MAG: hypothetical protein HY741_28800 [Chloroflexi bacterium]|nr:hypothetical protein [Chloroflexota bacterium]